MLFRNWNGGGATVGGAGINCFDVGGSSLVEWAGLRYVNPVRERARSDTSTASAKRWSAKIARRAHDYRGVLSATKARLMVMAYTGLPPAQIRTLRATDVDLEGAQRARPGTEEGRPDADGQAAVERARRHGLPSLHRGRLFRPRSP